MAFHVKVFARPKLCQNACSLVRLEEKRIRVGDVRGANMSPDVGRNCEFYFDHVFGLESRLGDVFDVAVRDMVEGFLGGCNGSIIAYGETGSGKTYTLEGDGSDGLIPRSLMLIFNELQKFQDDSASINVSFMEIYSEAAFDLLGTLMYLGNDVKELPKVMITVGPSCSHLSQHVAKTYQEAMKLHSLGKARRQVVRQYCDDRSARGSHTVFTVTMSRHIRVSEVILRSKLQMVDLAGSQIDENSTVKERKRANLSLDHLEEVVIALQKIELEFPYSNFSDKDPCSDHLQSQKITDTTLSRHAADVSADQNGRHRQHFERTESLTEEGTVSFTSTFTSIPYRNSLLTMMLQESLGGNCVTVVIATLLLGPENLQETISTCSFAQRVSRIVNRPIRNEKVDMVALITRLQRELAACENLHNYRFPPSEADESGRCVELMDSFINGRITKPVAQGVNSPEMFDTCLRYLRERLWALQAQGAGTETTSSDDRDSGLRLSSDSEMESNQSNLLARQQHGSPDTDCVFSLTGDTATSGRNEESSPGEPSKLVKPARPVCPEIVSTCTQSSTSSKQSKSNPNDRHALRNVGCCPSDSEGDEVTRMELELAKEALMQRSKMLMSALSDQEVRLVLLSKKGAIPQEVRNEKLAELHLQGSRRDVEQKLSIVVRQLVDLKKTSQSIASTGGRHVHSCAVHDHQVRKQRDIRTAKELELKEKATRQRLLARRQQLDKASAVTPSYSSSASRRHSVVESDTQMEALPLVELHPITAAASRHRLQTGQTSSPATSPRDMSSTAKKSRLKRELRRVGRKPNGSSFSANSRGLLNLSRKTTCWSNSRNVTHDNTAAVKTIIGASETPRVVCTVPDGDRCNMSLMDYLYRKNMSLYKVSTFPRRSTIDINTNASSYAKENIRLKKSRTTGIGSGKSAGAAYQHPYTESTPEHAEHTSNERTTRNAENTSNERPTKNDGNTSNERPPTKNAENTSNERPTKNAENTSNERPPKNAENTSNERPTKNAGNTSNERPTKNAENTSNERPTKNAENTSNERPPTKNAENTSNERPPTKNAKKTSNERTMHGVDKQPTLSVEGTIKEQRIVFLNKARSHQVRVLRVRRVLWAAQVIQGAWRRHLLRKLGV